MKKIYKTILAVLLGSSVFFMFGSIVRSAPISDYIAGELTTLPDYTDLSGGALAILSDGSKTAVYVDNKSGQVTYSYDSSKICSVGGDLEAVTEYKVGKLYTVNEAKNGVSVIGTQSCELYRRFLLTGLSVGSDGIEGIEVHNGIVYILDERSATIYTFVDDGISTSFTPQVLFTVPDCNEAGDLTFNGDNIVVACDSVPVAVEYTLTGDFVSQVDYSGLLNAEVIYFDENNNLVIGGEPNQIVVFTLDGEVVIDPPPPPPIDVFEACTFNGTVQVNVDTGVFDAQTVIFDCPTLTAEGTLQ